MIKRYKAAQNARASALSDGDDEAAKAAKDTMDALVLFKNDMGAFNRLYSFLSQMFDYGNTDIEKRFIFFKRLIPLLDYGRERDEVDLSKVVLTHHTLRSGGRHALDLKKGDAVKLPPMDAVGSGGVQDKEKAFLAEIIERVNGLFEGQLSENDQLVYVNGTLKGKLLESDTLVRQAMSNSKSQFDNSPDIMNAIIHAAMDADESYQEMTRQVLNSERVQRELMSILLGPGRLYESLRAKGLERPPGL